MAGSFSGGAPGTTLAGQTWTTVVAAPTTGQKQILSAKPRNADTVEHVYEQRILKGAVACALPDPRTVPVGELRELISNCLVLDASDEVYQVRTAETTTDNESVVVAAVFEVTP